MNIMTMLAQHRISAELHYMCAESAQCFDVSLVYPRCGYISWQTKCFRRSDLVFLLGMWLGIRIGAVDVWCSTLASVD